MYEPNLHEDLRHSSGHEGKEELLKDDHHWDFHHVVSENLVSVASFPCFCPCNFVAISLLLDVSQHILYSLVGTKLK